MAKKYWLQIPQHFPFVELGVFVVMPNHVHGIIIINKQDDGCNNNNVVVETQDFASHVETHDFASLQSKNKFGPQSKNLASIIRGFKLAVTINARKIDTDFLWQTRFYDHIIRNDESFQKISNYIINNPLQWNNDK